MATPEPIGTAACHHCGHTVYVRRNSGGFAYYRCEACGFEGRHHLVRQSEAFIKGRVKLIAAEEPEQPAQAKPAPAAKPAAPAAPRTGFSTLLG